MLVEYNGLTIDSALPVLPPANELIPRPRWLVSRYQDQKTPRCTGLRTARFKLFLLLLWVTTLVVVAWYLTDGAGYYLTPLIQRPHHPDYWELKPGGPTGHALGVAGSAMMVALLAYSFRKRLRSLRRAGPLGNWLDVHIWLGVTGPALVVLHTSFKVQGIVALSFWSMVVVVASGVLGRYIYLQIPRTRAGDEVSLEELSRQDEQLAERLREDFGIESDAVDRLVLPMGGGPASAAPMRALLWTFWDDFVSGFRIRRGVRRLRLPAATARALRRRLSEKARLHRRIRLLDAMQCLFHYWHVAHKPFAVVMYLFMLIHIAVAIVTGYGWGNGG